MLLTCYKVTKANCSQSDNHKVDGLQGCPSFDVFEDNCRNGHKDNAASQDEEYGRDHTDLCLAHLFFLENGNNKRKEKMIILLGLYTLWVADKSCWCNLVFLFHPFVSLLGRTQLSLSLSENPPWEIVNFYVWSQKNGDPHFPFTRQLLTYKKYILENQYWASERLSTLQFGFNI